MVLLLLVAIAIVAHCLEAWLYVATCSVVLVYATVRARRMRRTSADAGPGKTQAGQPRR